MQIRIRKLKNLQWETKVHIVVSKAISKRAVDRNRIRRQIRAALRDFTLPVKGKEIFIISSGPLPFAEIKEKLGTKFGQEKH